MHTTEMRGLEIDASGTIRMPLPSRDCACGGLMRGEFVLHESHAGLDGYATFSCERCKRIESDM